MSIKHIPAAVLAATLTLTSTIVVFEEFSGPLPLANAASTDFNPAHNVKINPAKDGARYEAELHSYQLISKLRHSYHSAAYDQKYDQYPGTAQTRTAADLSEWACYMAKARVILAILKVEGNSEARALDISKVGIDPDVTATAYPLVRAATADAFQHATNEELPAEERKLYQNRHKLFLDGSSRLTTVVDELKAGTNSGFEFDAFSVTNWGVSESFLEATRKEMNLSEEDLKVTVIDASATQQITFEQAKENGDANRAISASRFGTTNAQPTETTESSATTTTPAEPPRTSATNEPTTLSTGTGFFARFFNWFKNLFSPLFSNFPLSS